jgi:hypothetical protein
LQKWAKQKEEDKEVMHIEMLKLNNREESEDAGLRRPIQVQEILDS